jgi:predicted nucleotide-binding protein
VESVTALEETIRHLLRELKQLSDRVARGGGSSDPEVRAAYELLRGHAYSLLKGKTPLSRFFRPAGIAESYSHQPIAKRIFNDMARLAAVAKDVRENRRTWEDLLADDAASPAPLSRKVFLGHGRNPLWREVKDFLEDDLSLEVEAFESSSRTGKHVVEVLEGLLSSTGFAVIVATGDDTSDTGDSRARENVVHEIGLFQGHLGFTKVAILLQRGIEPFSNIHGLQRLEFSEERVRETFQGLRAVLAREGIVAAK